MSEYCFQRRHAARRGSVPGALYTVPGTALFALAGIAYFYRAMLRISPASAVVRCLSVTFVYCVKTAKDTTIVATEYE